MGILCQLLRQDLEVDGNVWVDCLHSGRLLFLVPEEKS